MLRCEKQNVCAECFKYSAHCKDATVCKPVKKKLRSYPGLRYTSDGFDCALPVAIDSHSVCSFGCLYCFSNNLIQHRENFSKEVGQTSLAMIDRILGGGGGKRGEQIRYALNYHKKKNGYPTPIQLGAITDPLDNIERNQGWFLKFAEIVKKYDQPVRISTKGNLFLLDEYIDAVKDKPHLFRVHFSIITCDDAILAKIDKRAPSATERIECMRRLEEVGVETCLRFRPILPGISDSTKNHPNAWKELIDMAHKAGCRNISYEVGFVPGRQTKDLKKKWKEIEQISGIPLNGIYKRFGKIQACMRPHHSWTEQIMFAIYDYCKELGWNIGVSDPCWKQLNDYGCCCAISPEHKVFGNWQREQGTEALLKAKNGKIITSKDVIPDWAYKTLAHDLINPGVGPKASFERRLVKWSDVLFQTWTELGKERSPLQYFQGAILPIGKLSDGDIQFKYVGLKRKNNKNTPYWKVNNGK